jgi:ubiquinone/menaquinone biosynthesis C-methylase UbiE
MSKLVTGDEIVMPDGVKPENYMSWLDMNGVGYKDSMYNYVRDKFEGDWQKAKSNISSIHQRGSDNDADAWFWLYDNFIEPRKIKTFLDVGANLGLFCFGLVDRHGYDVVGMDASPVLVAGAKEIGEKWGYTNPSFVFGDALKMPFKDKSFDVVYSQHVLEHLPSTFLALEEQKRVGKLVAGLAPINDNDGNAQHIFDLREEVVRDVMSRVFSWWETKLFPKAKGRPLDILAYVGYGEREKKKVAFACPYCFEKIVKTECSGCDYGMFRDSRGIIHAHRNDTTWDKCLGQVEAVRKAERGTNEYQAKRETLPTVERGNRAVDLNDKMIRTVIDIVQPSGKTFLEIGGAGGWASVRFLEEGAKEGFLLEIDETLIGYGIENLTSVLGDGYFLPFAEEQFDFVFDCSCLHHFEDKVAVLHQIKRVLRKGGYYLSQGNPPRKGWDDDDRDRYMRDFGLIETMPRREEYEGFFKEVFGNFNYVPVEDNSVMWVRKEE